MVKTVPVTVRLSEEKVTVLEYLGEVEDTDRGAVIRRALEDHIDFETLLPQAQEFFEERTRLINHHASASKQSSEVA